MIDFITEFIGLPRLTSRDAEKTVDAPTIEGSRAPDHGIERWKLFVDGSSNFKASNNEVEYEVLIASLDLARELGVEDIEVFSDSTLIVNQVIKEYQAKE